MSAEVKGVVIYIGTEELVLVCFKFISFLIKSFLIDAECYLKRMFESNKQIMLYIYVINVINFGGML